MDKSQLQQRRVSLTVLLGLAAFLIYMFSLRAMQVRQEGLGILEALITAAGGLVIWLPTAVMFAVFFLLITSKRSKHLTDHGDAVEAGRRHWHRLRIIVAMGTIPALIILGGIALYRLLSGQWSNEDWLIIVMWGVYAAILIVYWLKPPSRERLYAMGTGDTSRIMDERAQQVLGKTASTTLSIFFILLVFIGGPYEMIVEGSWPRETLVIAFVLAAIWSIASAYWNRRM